MPLRLTLMAALLLTLPPVLWACNAVLGRLLSAEVSPATLNLLRWVLAFILLLPLAGRVLRRDSALWPQWRHFAWLSLFSIGGYNALLYLALNSSTAINVTLVGASTPVWMLLIGRVLFAVPVTRRQWLGALLSILGVALVMGRGQWSVLQDLRPVAGDVYIALASIAWAYYSWLLVHPKAEAAPLRAHWATFLLAQVVFGLLWSGSFAGMEWALGAGHVQWSGWLLVALAFIAAGPAVVAYAAWGAGVARAGPVVAGFFINLTPLFTALLSSAVLQETPQPYHALAFFLIVAGIVLSSRR